MNPRSMCRQHLLGEHVEMHMFVGHLKRGRPVHNYIVRTDAIESRHEELSVEMLRRGYKHNSPLVYKDTVGVNTVDPIRSLRALCSRCNECHKQLT